MNRSVSKDKSNLIDFSEDINKLKPIHIFDYYEHPLFYVATNKNNEHFLFYFIESHDEYSESSWLISRISQHENLRILNRNIGVKSFLINLLDMNRLYKIKIQNGLLEQQQQLTYSNIDWDDFPQDDFEVEFDYLANKTLEKTKTIEEAQYFKLRFVDSTNSNSIPASLFQDVIKNLNEFIDASTNLLTQKNLSKPKLNLIALPASSFGAEFEIILEDEIDFDNLTTKITNSLVDFTEVLDSFDEKELSDQIFLEKRFSPKQAQTVKRLTQASINLGYDISFESKDSNKKKIKDVTITKSNKKLLEKIDNILKKNNKVEEHTIKIKATIVSVNLKKNGFWLDISDTDNKTFFSNAEHVNGKIKESLFNRLKDSNDEINIKVPSRIDATIKKKTTYDYTRSNEKSVIYELISFSSLN